MRAELYTSAVEDERGKEGIKSFFFFFLERNGAISARSASHAEAQPRLEQRVQYCSSGIEIFSTLSFAKY